MAKEKWKEITFRKLEWEGGDCVSKVETGCQNMATVEAVCGRKTVRCCENEDCKQRAAEFAELLAGI